MPKFNAERTRSIKAALGIGSMPAARTTVYAALHTSDPTPAANATEASGSGYARQAVSLTAESNGEVRNSADITWTNMPAGTYTHVSIWSASSAGSPIFYDSLPLPAILAAGENFTLKANNIIIREE